MHTPYRIGEGILNVWILKHGEQLPLTGKSRVYRMGMIALECAKMGSEVTWWTSDFNHAMKIPEDIKNIENKLIKYKFLRGVQYTKNISFKRIINHRQLGLKLQKEMEKNDTKPDLIISAMPTIDFAYKAVKFGKKYDIPVIIDIRDLWPDVFMDLIPVSILRREFLFTSFNYKLKWLLENASAVTAITEEYLQWALEKANLNYNQKKHKVFPIGYPSISVKSTISPLDNNFFNIIFIGTIGMHFDLETVLEVAKKTVNENIRFYIIGDGDKKELLKKNYPLSNVFFTGWLNGEELNKYLSNASIGVAPYKNTPNFLMNIPNKFYEYMAYSLPIITCLPGPSTELIIQNKVGLIYKENSIEELYECITKLKNDKGLYEEISKNAKKSFEEKYTTKVIYEKYYNFIQGFEN